MRDLIIQQVFPGTLNTILDSENPERFVHTAVMNLSKAKLTLLYGDGSVVIIELAFFGPADFRVLEIQEYGTIISLGKDKYSVEWLKVVEDERVQVKK